jgi:1-acyl-sn-glycerol-3-phosphate acyltransferase
MDRLRAGLRVFLVIGLTLGFYTLWLLGRAVLGGKVRARWRLAILRGWGRSAGWAIGMRIEHQGPRPPPGSLLVCNHVGWTDILLLNALLGATFVSKEEVVRWPILGWASRSVGTIFVVRENKRQLPEVNSSIERALARGECVVLFPEGTTTEHGEGVMPFRPALLEPAAGSRYPVYCAALHYRTPPGSPPASEIVGWWGGITFAGHMLRLLRLPYFVGCARFDGEPVREEDRKVLAERTWKRVASLHGAGSEAAEAADGGSPGFPEQARLATGAPPH